MMNWISSDLGSFIVFIALVAGTAFLGGQWGAGPWYAALSKPSWTPPNWLFPVAWSVLYLMIAIAGWLVWTGPEEGRTLLLGLWIAQLLINASWSYVFFGRQDIALGLIDILALWTFIAAFIAVAWPVHNSAALLFLPYLVWVSYAAALNASILMRNTPQG